MTTLATHSGPFHADDVLAYVILSGVFDEVQLIRSREPRVLAATDVVFDVGGEYDPVRRRYDHHQSGGAGCRDNGVPYATAGLVWRHFGTDYCRTKGQHGRTAPEALAAAIDLAVIQGVDAVDAGCLEYAPPVLKGRPDTPVRLHHLSALVASLNPSPPLEDDSLEAFNRAFVTAAAAARPFFDRFLVIEASRLEAAMLLRRFDTGGPILELERFCPWQETVSRALPHIHFVLTPKAEGGWVCHPVPRTPVGREVRTPLPAAWYGLIGAALQALTGVNDATFCHPNGFLCGAHTREGAKRLALLALQGSMVE